MTVAVVILVPMAVARAGGPGAAMAHMEEGFLNPTHSDYDLIYVLGFILLVTLAYSSINWSLIQRYYCVPREKDATRVGWLVVGLFLIGPPLILLPAMLAGQFLVVPEGQEVYAVLCTQLLPTEMVGLVSAAMFAATMSMFSSDYNVCAAVLTNDVYGRLFRRDAS